MRSAASASSVAARSHSRRNSLLFSTWSALRAWASLSGAEGGTSSSGASLPSGRAARGSSLWAAKRRSSGRKCWAALAGRGGLPCTTRTMSGRRLLSRLRMLCTPLMLSSFAMAENLPRASHGRYTFCPAWSKHRRNREPRPPPPPPPRPDPTTSPTTTSVSPAATCRAFSVMASTSSERDTYALTLSRTSAESGKRRASSATLSMHRTARPSSLRISK
ncbi:hypothetical protein E2C01_071767 [Portunus trituberculatus]|uniref:Uncharacterized protein n=1 Tax=Portunus trituberculatus TaxID=210409 RepID=A0A5B7I5A7_PORTR|nr:hypothetical protein [Portunus trituberculatus]